ncbi:MAG: DUF5666 domain-containing protein [candidate division KSB1 bacterium]|nr:DUF5666 domain-containing protein [candidate division KSB1 bacterium]MDZ7273137.1 DUF5666 domain-containing protein [candidate division KSB1 bacterium]MDZ7285239.1 DUF5666 domain-containing protein [candidate division KSB1 bacterium]MDZ7298271.1 DUF5666 domain-containing protein [candidate division KSB1 bacterium]MDZ7349096.1 DUF5666 domain-containing protein [candidate division KSB1 bacterium]
MIATNINYLDLEKNEFELQPAGGGDSRKGSFLNHLNGSYEARIPLADLNQRYSAWVFRAEIRDHRNGQFKAEVPIVIQARPGVGDSLLVTGRIEVATRDYIILSGNNVIHLDNRTRVIEGGRILSPGDLKPNWKVQVLAERRSDDKLWARFIVVLDRSSSYEIETKGYVASIVDSVVTINNIAFRVVATTRLLDEDNDPVSLAAFKVGMEVQAKGTHLASGEVIALRLRIEDEDYSDHEIELTGHIAALIDSVRRYVVVGNTSFEVTASTEILGFDNEPITFADLHVGELVEVKGRTRSNDVPLATRIEREDQNGSDLELVGVITAVGDSSVTVNGVRFRITATTIFLDENNNFITFSALRTGMVVEVHADILPGSTPVATRIKIRKQTPQTFEIKGFISQISDTSVTVLGLTFLVDSSTEVRDEDDSPVPFSTLRTGMLVEVKAFVGTDQKFHATRIAIEDFDREEIELRGVITNLNGIEKYVEVSGLKFFVTSSTVITDRQGNAITFETLAIGQVVEVHARQEAGRWLATRIHVQDRIAPVVEIVGRIERIVRNGGDTLYLFNRPFVVTNATVIVDRQKQPIPLAALQVGDFVEVRAQLIADQIFIALRVELRNPAGNVEFEFTGTLTALSAAAIYVEGIEFQVNSATVYLGPDNQPITINDLHPGMTVEVKARLQGGQFLASRVKVQDRRALAGSLTQVSGNTIHVQDLPHVITTTSLLFDAQNQPVTMSALRPGQQVELVAQVNQSQLEVVTLRIVSSGITGVQENHSPAAPGSFALWQNYPNPFNPSTVIRFALPQAGQMRLAVYNILGQPVRTLMEGVRPAGEFQVTWDGRDNRGRQVASGVYFYRLEAQGQVQTRKLTLMR